MSINCGKELIMVVWACGMVTNKCTVMNSDQITINKCKSVGIIINKAMGSRGRPKQNGLR